VLADMAEFVTIVTQALLDRLGLLEQARAVLQAIATAVCPALAAPDVRQRLRDAEQIQPTLLAWAKESLEQALPSVRETALQQFLRARAEGISAERVRWAAMTAVDECTLTQEHVVTLLEGDLLELVRLLLGSAAAATLNDLTAGSSRRLCRAC
jgi:hypothetical protein